MSLWRGRRRGHEKGPGSSLLLQGAERFWGQAPKGAGTYNRGMAQKRPQIFLNATAVWLTF